MDILELFKEQLLKDRSTSSKSTLKNYLSDVRHFISWFEKSTHSTFEVKDITPDVIVLYEQSLGGLIEDAKLNVATQLSAASMKRHLSSLRKFFALLEREGHISHNPFTQIQPEASEVPTDLWHLKSFKDALLLQKASKITVKNYLSDISGFAKWYEETILPGLEKPLSATGGFYLLTQEIIEDYRKRLLEVQNAAPRTVNRKLSALRRYLNFVTEKGFVSLNELSIDPVRVFEERMTSVESPSVELTELPVVTKKEKTHSKFPPVRLLQKLVIFPYLALEEKAATSIATFISGKPLNGLDKLPPKLASIVEAKNVLRGKTNSISNILGVRNVSKEFYAPDKVSLLGTPLYKRLIYHAKFTRPNWYKRYHNYSFVHYVHFALLVIFASGVGVALYQNLVAKKQAPTFAAATAPPRIISFQGRLTDNLDNPITSTSALRFAIYNDASASGGALLWQEAITNITPDQDGIFSILLGGGTQIPSTVFTDNSQIYLGVTVGTTSELSPRQRIASVGYATNSEFLQGQPPTTQAGITSFTNVILALDSSGNLTLADSATTNHTFQVSNGAFNLKGQTLYLTTNSGSGGNVILSPDGLGKIDIQRPIINTTTMGNIVPGGVEVNDKFGVLATESAVAAFTVNNNTSGGDILAASSSGTTRFKIANDGTLTDGVYNTAGGIFYGSNTNGTFAQTTAGSLGQCLQSTAGGAPTWSTCGGSDWRTNLGTLSPNNDTLDLLVGGNTTASAKFRFVNVNTGTPVASVSANSGNNSTFISGDGTLGTTNRATLTIGNSSTYNTTGNLLFNPNGIGRIGIGTTSPLIGFDLRGNSGTTAAASISANTSFATLLVDNSGSGDLIAASASGVPNFVVKNNGDVIIGQGGAGKLTASVIDPYLVQNQKTTGTQSLTFQTMGATNADFIFKNTSTTLSTLTQAGQLQLPVTGSTGGIVIGGDTQIFRGAADRLDVASGDSFNVVNGNLQIGGTTVIDSSRNGTFQTLNITGGCTGCTVGAPSPFQALSGAIVPLNGTLDLLVGSQATTSAKFSVLNISNGTPTASVSATSTGAGLSIAGDGTLQGTLNNNIVIGGNTTGAIQFKPNNSSVSMFLSGANVAIGNQTPQASLDVSQNSHLSAAVDKIIFGSIGNTIGVLGYDGAANDEIRIGAQSNKGLELLTNNTTQAYITNTGNFGIGSTSPTAKLDVNGTASVSGAFKIYGTPTIQSTSNQTLTLGGDTTGDIQLKPGNATNPTVYFATGGNVGINISTPTNLLTINQGSNTTTNTIASYGFNLFNQGVTNFTIGSDASYAYLQSWASKPLQINNQGNNVLLNINTGLVGIGTTAPVAKLQINGGNEGGNSAFIVNQTGVSTNDIFAASASGTTKFTIKNDGTASSSAGFTINGTGALQSTKNQTLTIGGNSTGAIVLSPNNGAGTLQFTNFTTNGGILYTNTAGVLSQTAGGTGTQCLLGNLSWGSCGTGTTSTPFYESLGAIVPFQGSEDFLIGAQATTSAKFAVLNVNNGTPTASVSSGLNGTSAYFDANGNFRTANKMSLTLGGGNTGNITIQGNNTLYLIDQAINLSAINPTLSANGSSTLTLNNNSTGNIQFFSSSNTLTNAGALTIAGSATINGGTVQLANGAQGTIQTASNADIVITAGSGTINLNTVSNGPVLTGSGLTTLGGGLTVNGATTTFGNAAPLITTGTNTDLTITPNGTGNLIITSDFNTGVRIGSSSNTPALLSVSGGIGSNAGFILNRVGATDDIFAASSSGTTKFVIKNDGTASTSGNLVLDGTGSLQTTKNQTLTIGGTSTGNIVLSPNNGSGNIRFSNFSTNNGLLYTNGSGVLSQTGAGGALQCLLGDLTWGSCGTGTSRTPFQELLGAVVQNNTTEDFLAGGQASTSAVLKVTGQGNPFAGTLVGASISANTSFAGFLADNKGVGDLFTASSSGVTQFVIRNNGAVGIGTNVPGAMLDVNGNLLLGANSTIDARASGTITIGNGTNTTGLTLGKAGTTTTFNATSWTATPTISGLVTGTLGFSVAAGQSYTGAGAVTLSSASNNDLTVTAQGSGNTIITSDFDTGVRIGASTNTPAALSVSGGIGSNAGFILNRVGTTDDIFAASSAGTTKFVIKNDGTASSSAGFTINGAGNIQSTRNQTLTLGGNSTGTILLQPNNGSGNVGINNSNPFSALSVDGNIELGTGVTTRQLTAYNSTRTNHGTLELYNLATGSLTLSTDFSTGNIVLTPGASGSIQMTNFTSNGGLLYTNGSGVLSQVTAGSTSQCLFGGTTPSFNNCAAGFGSPFREFSGAIVQLNTTEDFLAGGQASTSATFKVTGQGNPFAGTLVGASISANTSFAGFVVDNKGVGDIFTASSSGVPQFVIKNNGNVGIGLGTGTAGIPTAKLDVNGTASISSALTFRTGTGSIQTTANNTLTLGGGTTGNLIVGRTSQVITLPGFDCSAQTNGGKLTTTTGGILACSADTSGVSGFASPFRESSNPAGSIFALNSTEDILLGGPSSTSAALRIIGQENPFKGTLAAATISANTSFAGFVVDNKGVGDLFTASSSGVTQFQIKNGGAVGIGAIAANRPTAMLDVVGTASISSQLAFRTGAGSIQTTAMNPLTIGGSTTGNVSIKSSNTTVFQAPGTANIFVGADAGRINSSGSHNSFFGYQTGYNNTTGSFNFFLGDSAGFANIGGSNNSFIGLQAGVANQSGGNNLFLGNSSGATNISGSSNTFVGESSGFSNTASFNTFIGNSAGYSNGAGTGNVFIGYLAGDTSNNANANLTGNNNTFIGYQSGPATTTQLTNATALGYQALVSSSNSLILGGTGANAVKAGIGTQSPTGVLDIQGGFMGGNAALIINQTGSSNNNILTASSSGITKFVVGNDGQVLFGNAAADPSTALGAGSVYYNSGSQALKFYNGSTWSTIGSGNSSSPFKEALGAILQNQPTEDFLLGGNATSSADFAVLNLNSGTPTASVSATATGKGLSLAGDGTIQALRYNTLTIGGNTTGDIAFTPGNITAKNGLYLSSNGNVSIGNINAPQNTLLPNPKFQIFGSIGHAPVASISAQPTAVAPTLLLTVDGTNDVFVASKSGQPIFRIDSSGAVHAGGNYSNDYGADVAEYYRKANPNEQFQPGQLVCLTGTDVTKCSSNNPQQKIVGVISDRAMLVGFGKYSNDPNYVLVGMVGQLGVWTTGDIKAGDPLTLSTTPGVATIAKGEGNIIGYAREDNNNQLKRIESVIQPNYFNPNTALQTDNVFNSLTLSIQNGVYNVFDAFGNSINHIDAFSKALIGNLTAGFASIQTLVVNTFTATTSSLGNATASTFAVAANTITIGGQDIRQFIIDTVRNAGFGQNTLTTPLATGAIETNVISPLADNSTVQLNVNKDNVEVKNTDTGKTVAWFNNQGNATLSGQLTSEGVQTTNATVSGTLAANSITTTDASVSGTITANTIVATNISGLDQKLATLAAALQNNNSASNSSQVNNNYLASDTIHANFGIFEQGITSMGPVTSNIITATDQLAVGNSFTITNNSINTVGADLQIQSLRQGNIAFEGGLIKMDTDGNMLVSGNLNLLGEIDAVHGVFSGTLTAPALATGLISPLPGDDLDIKLSDSASTSGRLKIVNQQNQEVLSINSHGDLNASGSGTFAKLNFNLVGKAEATSLTEAVATGSAGFATLRQGQVELTIKNPIITSKSLIYITPYGDTNNKVIYLLRQVPQSEVDDGSFTVGISGTPAPADIQFNWLIVN